MITLSIDVTQIDKARLKEVTRKNGQPAKFLDLVLVETPNSPYGDFLVKQQVTKEERLAKKDMPVLGNAKIYGQDSKRPAARPAESNHTPPENDDVPF